MCDSLGQSDQKVKVWLVPNFENESQKLILCSMDDLKDWVEANFNDMFENESIKMKIECKYMYEHEIEELGEAD